MSGIVQLQGLMAQMATKPPTTGGSSGVTGPEVVRPGVTEIARLPQATPEGALQFSDWLHAVRPSMSDLSDTSSQCWEGALGEAQRWCNTTFVPATPVQRLRLKLPCSMVDSEPRWSRVKHRMEHLVLQACPEGVREELSAARIAGLLHVLCRLHVIYKPGGLPERTEALRQVQNPKAADSAVDAVLKLRTWRRWLTRLGDLGGSKPDPAVQIQALEIITSGILKSLGSVNFRVNLVWAALQLDTQPTNDRVEEYYEHILAELESASRVSEANKEAKDRGAQARQVDAKVSQGAQAEGKGAGVAKPAVKGGGTSTSSGGDSVKRPCKWYHEGKGCKKGGECAYSHDWSAIPKAERSDRCMRCGGVGHRKDTCQAPAGTPKSRSEAGTPKAQAKEAAPRPKADAGLKKVLSEAAGVLREALKSSAAEGDSSSELGSPAAKATSTTTEGLSAASRAAADPSVMATAAKIEAQIQDLEARVLDGARIRAVATEDPVEDREPTALLDSGATHTVLDPTTVGTGDLAPCMVSLAGDQKQLWKQTPGGSLVAPGRDGGGETQTILPLGSLIEQLGCSIRWTRKGGLQLTHPRMGRLETSIRSGCPQLSKRQALQLVRELEGAHVGELESRLRRVQSQLAAQTDKEFHAILDDFIGSGTQVSAQMLVDRMPFLANIPARVTAKLAVGLDNVKGWELLKALPVNRRQRKRMHNSTSWVISLCSGSGDQRLRDQCQAQGHELVEVDLVRAQGWDLTNEALWKALSWAAFTGRVSAILADPPTRTWYQVRTQELPAVQVRSYHQPWGADSLKPSTQARVDEDTLLGVQPLWLWTVASIAKGEGVPFCYTAGDPDITDLKAWDELVIGPFARWSNTTQRKVPWTSEGTKHTRPLRVCSNLRLSDRSLSGLGTQESKPAVCVASWPEGFKGQVRAALFIESSAPFSRTASPLVRAVGQSSKPIPSRGTHPDEVAEFLKELDATPLGNEPAEVGGEGAATPKEQHQETLGQQSTETPSLTEAQREGWKRHLEAHHVPYRKDCLQCVMSGSLGLQHRRSKCPNMYALSFDLAGPFKELGKDDRGGRYRYALVAGLRVPCEALPQGKEVRREKGSIVSEGEYPLITKFPPPVQPTEQKGEQQSQVIEEEDEVRSVASWFDPSDYEPDENLDPLLLEPDAKDEPPLSKDEELHDPWEDHQAISKLSNEEFDKEIAKMVFSGNNKVLRFVVPMKGRSGAQILPALQEVIAECNRLGFPVKTAHTDRAREAVSKATTDWLQSQLIQPSFTQGDDPKANGLAERLVGWVKTRARLHLSSSGLGLEHWPTAMTLACAEHRHQVLQLPGRVHQYGQRVVFKSKHPTGESKKPFLRWEYGTYLCPCSRTESGNVRPTDELVDPERVLGGRPVLEAQLEEEDQGEPMKIPRRVTGKRSVRVVARASEQLALELRTQGDFSAEACSRLLSASFGDAVGCSKQSHRGPVNFSVVLGAYGHGGLRGITKATYVYPQLCRYLNEYLRKGIVSFDEEPRWSAVTIVQADEVGVHRDSRNEPWLYELRCCSYRSEPVDQQRGCFNSEWSGEGE